MPESNGYVLWEGNSLLAEEAPVAVVATGFINESANTKTGPMIQVWILHASVSPLQAIKSGQDESICGQCRHRGSNGKSRSCYVEVGRAPTAVWDAYKRERYSRDTPDFSGRLVRLGAYGDPAAAPLGVWEQVCRSALGWTGYTHQWRTCAADYARFCMASCDTPTERAEARLRGYRVFRVGTSSDHKPISSEWICPASAEAGNLLTCARCMACSGTEGNRHGDRVIRVHGTKGAIRAFEEAA